MFRAEARGRRLTFENAGLVGGNEVFKDRETGSRWQQSSLQAISGPMEGAHLKLYPFLQTSWGEWRRLHAETLVLKPLPGYAERIAAKNEQLRAGFARSAPAPEGVLHRDDRLEPHAKIVGLDIADQSKAFPLDVLEGVKVVNDELGGSPVLVVYQPKSETATAFLARAKGRRLTFKAANGDATELADAETGSRWDPYGRCTAGPLKGSQLEMAILEPEYWFAWSEFHPATAVYGGK